MKPINFPGVNVTYGAGQPEYQPLPVQRLADGTAISCWEFTDQEIADIVKNRKMFIMQSTFNQPLQPILPLVNLEDGITLT